VIRETSSNNPDTPAPARNPAPSVKVSTATVYSGDDRGCTGVTHPAGAGFIDEGGGQASIAQLDDAGHKQMMSRLMRALNSGELKGRL
jgi:hypothetical protein